MSVVGYSENFMGVGAIAYPKVQPEELKKFEDDGLRALDYALDYTNYSVFQNPFRKFPYYTACNIDGGLFQKIKRDELFSGKGDKWAKDDRIPKEHQWGNELYRADRSDFDKGHLTKREDTQWGVHREDAIKGAESTFFFTNAMPQVDRLNRGVWRKIEDYILHQEVIQNDRKIVLFTGPVFGQHDPDFVTKVKEETIQLPYLFWKVIYYQKGETLHRTGFLTSQKGLLEKRRIVKPVVRGDAVDEDPFMTFKDAATYQVQVAFIETLSGLTFAAADEQFVRDEASELILSGIDVRGELADDLSQASMNLIL
jgi:endonuclease G